MTFCICRIQYTHKNLYVNPNTEIKETNGMKQLNYRRNVEENLASFLSILQVQRIRSKTHSKSNKRKPLRQIQIIDKLLYIPVKVFAIFKTDCSLEFQKHLIHLVSQRVTL